MDKNDSIELNLDCQSNRTVDANGIYTVGVMRQPTTEMNFVLLEFYENPRPTIHIRMVLVVFYLSRTCGANVFPESTREPAVI